MVIRFSMGLGAGTAATGMAFGVVALESEAMAERKKKTENSCEYHSSDTIKKVGK